MAKQTAAAGAAGDTTVLEMPADDFSLTVNAYLNAVKRAAAGYAGADEEARQHIRALHNRYWRFFFSALSGILAKSRSALEFGDDDRLLIDLGVIDARMLGGDREANARELMGELRGNGPTGTFYLTEWLAHRYNQLQLEDSVARTADGQNRYASQLIETRQRILSRLSALFAGLPGIPAEVSRSMTSGELDDTILGLGIKLLSRSSRPLLLRRCHLWQLRGQVIAKARARAGGQATLKLFDILDDIYARDWRERYDRYVRLEEDGVAGDGDGQTEARAAQDTQSVVFTPTGQVLLEARQMRMRLALDAAMNGAPRPDVILHTRGPRLTKRDLSTFLPQVQTFDRAFTELPPIIVLPGAGRGMFAWEIGCVLLSLRPLAGYEDSIATAFALQRMVDDRLGNGDKLRRAYLQRFPGADFHKEFPVDYRAWLCRLTKGDASAMNPERRSFFRDFIGPDISGPILPVNLRLIGPQTRDIICRRLEKQLTTDEKDVNLHRRLGALYWQQDNMEAAALQYTAAMQLDPSSGETLFAMGMFMRARDDIRSANMFFTYGAQRAADSLWGIYCQDALANMF